METALPYWLVRTAAPEELRRYDPGQKRDPDGTWGDGIPGPGLPDLDMEGFSLISEAEGTFGTLRMGVDQAGDVRMAFHEGHEPRAVDLSSDEVADLGDILDRLAAYRDEELPDDADPSGVYDDDRFGFDNAHHVELLGSGVVSITFGAEEDDPWTLVLDPPSDEVDDVLTEVDASRSAGGGELRRFNPNQKRDPNGEWGDGIPGASALKDALKLAGKIDLAPDETLVSSAKVDGGAGGIRMALTEHNGQRTLRFGVGGEGYGKPNREEGTPAWDGNPSRTPLSKAERERLFTEEEALDEEWDGASPARQDEIDSRREAIREQLAADDQGFNGTAKLDEYSMRRLADRIRPALAEAVEQEKAENAAWDEIEALEAKGNPDPARMAELRRIVDRDSIIFTQGVVPGSEWGDVHFSVELDDLSVGPEVRLGVQPKGAPDDWGDDKDWQGRFGPAETRKFLRLLDQYTVAASRSRNPKEALVFERYNEQPAPAGSANGRRFTSGGSGSQDKKPAPPKRTLLAQTKGMRSLPATKRRSAVMDFCVRSFGFEFEERARSSDGRTLEGYAAVFDTPTRIAAVGGDFDEVISRGAFTRSIRSRMPVLQFEHGRDPRVGAVPIGSIDDLSEDSQGLHVRATLFDNPVVEPVRQAIAGRAIKGMSFRFNVAAGGDNWQRRSGDVDLRTVGDADVHELGPVVFPAYDSTTVSVRSLLAQLGPEEHLTLLRELAHDLRSIEPTGVGPSARSSGGADLDQDRSHEEPRLSIRQRLDQGALRSRGILK